MYSRAIHSILAATDLTHASDEILHTAARLAESSGAELHVVHAFDFEVHTQETTPTGGFPARIQTAEHALDEQIQRAIPPGCSVASREVAIYIAHKEILLRAAQVDADLIVLGPHRKRPLMDQVLGTTAGRVVRGATVPCLVVRAPIAPPLRRVVVATDLSAMARGALDEALLWSRLFGEQAAAPGDMSELRVLYVSSHGGATVESALAEEVGAALERAGGAGVSLVEREVVAGDSPADEIVRYAEREEADLLVMGTSGHGTFRHLLQGRVMNTVSRLAPCSVLLVPPRHG